MPPMANCAKYWPSQRRPGDLAAAVRAMDAAEAAGLAPVKVNVVVIAGVNDDEILDFAAFAREYGRVVRFIEYMRRRPRRGAQRGGVFSPYGPSHLRRACVDPVSVDNPPSRFPCWIL